MGRQMRRDEFLFQGWTGEKEGRFGYHRAIVLSDRSKRRFCFEIQGKLRDISEPPFGLSLKQIGLLELGEPSAFGAAHGAG